MAIRFPAENGEKKSHLGRIRSRLRICPKCCFPFCAAAEERIATSRCSRPAPRNDMQKGARYLHSNPPVRNDMQKTVGFLRLQGGGSQ